MRRRQLPVTWRAPAGAIALLIPAALLIACGGDTREPAAKKARPPGVPAPHARPPVGSSAAVRPPDLEGPSAARPLALGTGLYPRVIRLESSGAHNGRILASVVSFRGRPGRLDGLGTIYESTDGGAGFTKVGTIEDPEAAAGRGLCCGTLYELPQQVGPLAAGTLLWGASVGAGQPARSRRMLLRVWTSTDQGRNWSYLSNCAYAVNNRGLWEPEFSVDKYGRLVCHFSDETQHPRHSQVLARKVSTDGGRTWQPKVNTVASPLDKDRPGMANVRRLPNGSYLMSYEFCSLARRGCGAFVRTSRDGWDWGSPRSFGTRAETKDGKFFRRAPTIALAPWGGHDGAILLVGQRLHERDRKPSAASGRRIFVNTRNGKGPWREMAAPVHVRVPGDVYCRNISSTMLASADGRRLLQIATDDIRGQCQPIIGIGRIQPLG